MLILSAQDVDTCLPMKTAIEGMRHAFAASSAGELQMPDRSSVTLNSPSSLALFMPAHIKDSPIVSVKTVTIVPTNKVASLPIVQSVVIAFDASTGSPVALLDGSRLTAIQGILGRLACEIARELARVIFYKIHEVGPIRALLTSPLP